MTLPLDPISLADIAAAQNTRDTSLTNLGTSRTLAQKDYGYNATYDQNGLVASLAQDPNNPYSKASLLQLSHDNHLAVNKQNFANRGQYYSGSFGVAQSLEDQNFSQGNAGLRNAFINFIARNQGGINAANSKYTTDYGSALAGNVTRAAANDTGQGGEVPAAAPVPVGNSPIPAGGVASSFKQAARAQFKKKPLSFGWGGR
jgi:hypothetical protein